MDHMQQFVQELKIGTTLQEIWEIALENKRKEKNNIRWKVGPGGVQIPFTTKPSKLKEVLTKVKEKGAQ